MALDSAFLSAMQIVFPFQICGVPFEDHMLTFKIAVFRTKPALLYLRHAN